MYTFFYSNAFHSIAIGDERPYIADECPYVGDECAATDGGGRRESIACKNRVRC